MTENLLALDVVQAQHSVIGSILIDNSCVGLVVSKLSENDFSDPTCRNAFIAAKHLFAAGRPVDPITLQDAVGGGETWAKWARQLIDLTPTSANVEAYAEIVRKQSAFFAIRAQAEAILQTINLEEASELVKKMSGFLVSSSQVHTWTAAELAKDFITRMASTEAPEFLQWVFPSISARAHVALGDYVVLGGYPSAGKTLVSLMMALLHAKKYRVGYYTLETQPEKMADRMFSYLAAVNLTKIKKHDLDANELALVKEAAKLFATQTPIEFTQATHWSVEDIMAHALSRGYQIIYIDYLQLIAGENNVSENDRLAKISTSLKNFGQRNKISVIALAQLKRNEGPKGRRAKWQPPDLSSFRGSGQIEQDADVAFLLYPEDPEDNASNRILKLAKNKDGPRWKCSLAFHGSTQMMSEIIEDKSKVVAREMQAAGRAAKQNAYIAQTDQQVSFEELAGDDSDNPFNK